MTRFYNVMVFKNMYLRVMTVSYYMQITVDLTYYLLYLMFRFERNVAVQANYQIYLDGP